MEPILSHGLCLRPLQDSDAEALVVAARESVATVGRWMPWCHREYTAEEARQWIAVCEQALAEMSAFNLGVFSADGTELLGGGGLNQFSKLHNFCIWVTGFASPSNGRASPPALCRHWPTLVSPSWVSHESKSWLPKGTSPATASPEKSEHSLNAWHAIVSSARRSRGRVSLFAGDTVGLLKTEGHQNFHHGRSCSGSTSDCGASFADVINTSSGSSTQLRLPPRPPVVSISRRLGR